MTTQGIDVNDTKIARTLYSKTAKLEKELVAALKKCKTPSDKNITSLRLSIRKNYEEILFLDIDFSIQKDIDHLLWKCVYYKPIEEYRKLIKTYHTTAFKQSSTPQEKEKLHQICTSFRAFLDEATSYYEQLINKLKQKYGEPTDPNAKHILSLHKCLVILGDLERYRQLYNEKQQKDWTLATQHYEKALELIPSNGNPHNQLAVLATYQGNELEAIYRYFRSLSVKKPFISARENLILLFEKNRKNFKKIIRNEKTRKRDFMLEFVRVHGILFSRISFEEFEKVKSTTLNDFTVLLRDEQLPELLVLKLIIMNIFSIENAMNTPPDSAVPKEFVVQNATIFALSMFSALLSDTIYKKTSSKKNDFPNLGAIVTFLQWIQRRKDVIIQYKEALRQVWENVAELFNLITEINVEKSIDENYLPEDIELLGFLPLEKQDKIIKSDAPIASENQILNKRIIILKELANDFVNDKSIDLHFDEQDNLYVVIEKSKLKETEKQESLLSNKMKDINLKESKPSPPKQDQFISSKFILQREEEITDEIIAQKDEEADDVILFKPEKSDRVKDNRVIEKPFGDSVNIDQISRFQQSTTWNKTPSKSFDNSFFTLFGNPQRNENSQGENWKGFMNPMMSYSPNGTFMDQSGQQTKVPKMNNGNITHDRVIERPFKPGTSNQQQQHTQQNVINNPFTWRGPFNSNPQNQFFNTQQNEFFQFPGSLQQQKSTNSFIP